MRDAEIADAELERLARCALEGWDITPESVSLVARSENLVFRVDSATETAYVLRIHRPGYHSLAELEAERLWTGALIRAGIGAPVGLVTRDGQGYASVHVPGSLEARFVGLARWVEGEPLRSVIEAAGETGPVAAPFEALGRVAARVHAQAASWRPPPRFERHALDENGLMGDAPFWGPFWSSAALNDGEKKRLRSLRDRIYSVLAQLDKSPRNYSLIHADLHPGNVLVHAEGLHVIDFDDAAYGWHAYELAVALRAYEDDPRYESILDALVAGYRAIRPLDDEQVALIPLFLMVRALQLIGWIAARPELGRDDEVPGLVARAERDAARLLPA